MSQKVLRELRDLMMIPVEQMSETERTQYELLSEKFDDEFVKEK